MGQWIIIIRPLMSRLRPLFTALLTLGCATPYCLRAAPAQGLPTASLARLVHRRHARARLIAGGARISADHAVRDRQGRWTLKGNVVIRQGQRVIRANHVVYDSRRNSVSTRGGVEFSDPLVRITGKGGRYSPTRGALFNSARFTLLRRNARGRAATLRLTPLGVLRLRHVTFTTCPLPKPSWVMRAKTITINTHNRIGTGRDARVVLHGVPIFYTPWVSFPVGNVRKTGFLFPTLGNTSTSGLQITTPFYWNIAPNADLTLMPTEYQRRGIALGGQARLLTAAEHTELEWDYLPYDNAYHGSRSFIRLRSAADLPAGLRLTLAGANVSDSQYFEDFASGPDGASTAFLNRRAVLSYRSIHWNVQGMLQQFQTIDTTLPQNERPYAEVPDITVRAHYGWGPADVLRYGFSSQLVDFQRPDGSTAVSGWRFDATPRVSLNLGGPGYFVRPAIAWRTTEYELSHTAPGAPTHPSRNLPIASLYAGLKLERLLGRHGRRELELEPRAMYLYVPYRNQSNLPIFDTGLPDLEPVELFRTNRYVGADRQGDADQVNAALTARLLGTATGRQYLSATIGEEFYLRPPRVTLPGETPQTSAFGGIIAKLSVTAVRDWRASAELQWNPQHSQAERAQASLQYRPGPQRVINLEYRFERDTIEQQGGFAVLCSTAPALVSGSSCGIQQAEISGAWPIARHWSVFARAIYSMLDHQALERFVGFEYRSCCWSIRFGARRYVALRPVEATARSGTQVTGVYLEVELNGLASVGSAPDGFLSEAIPGYTPEEPNSLATMP